MKQDTLQSGRTSQITALRTRPAKLTVSQGKVDAAEEWKRLVFRALILADGAQSNVREELEFYHADMRNGVRQLVTNNGGQLLNP